MQTRIGIIAAATAVVIIVAVGAFLRFGASDPAAPPRPAGAMSAFVPTPEARAAPHEAWHDASGSAVSLGDFRGSVVLLNFWATWCAPCLEELPSINALQAELGGDGFEAVALNVDRDGEDAARPMMERLKLDALTLYLDPENRLIRDLGVQVMPTTILFDAAGREIGRLEGAAEWDAPEAVEFISFYVANPDFLDR